MNKPEPYSPDVYKLEGLVREVGRFRRLPELSAAQGATAEVLRTLHPLIVVTAGADEFYPYRD